MIANVVPNVAAHPLAEQRRLGVLATVNSDDPGMMRFDLADEYAAVASGYGWSLEEMEQVSLDGIEASWMSDEDKKLLRTRFLTEFDSLRAEHSLPPRA
jgi:adenosine deaminase